LKNDKLASGELGAFGGRGRRRNLMLVRDAHLIGIAQRRDSNLSERSLFERSQ
jgi:hypothetical protein